MNKCICYYSKLSASQLSSSFGQQLQQHVELVVVIPVWFLVHATHAVDPTSYVAIMVTPFF